MSKSKECVNFRDLSVADMGRMAASFEKRVNEAQLANKPTKEMVKKALRGQGSGHCPVRLKRLSLDLILRYNDALADLFCQYPDDLLGIIPYDMFIGYQSEGKPDRINPIQAMMQDSQWTDEWGTRWAHAKGGVGATTVGYPLADWSVLDDYLKNMPDPRAAGRLDSAVAVLREHGHTKYCMGVVNFTLWERMNSLRGMENSFMDFYTDEANVMRVMDAVEEYVLELIRYWGELGADAIFLTDDWGSQNSLMISPEMWRKFFKKRYERIFGEVHRLGMDVMLHSCGNVMDLVGDLIDVGLDVLDPLQPGAMDLEKLAREYGGKIGFCGAVDIQKLLPYGTPGQVKDEIRRLIDLLGRSWGGRFIVSPANMMGPDMPLENLQALFEVCHER